MKSAGSHINSILTRSQIHIFFFSTAHCVSLSLERRAAHIRDVHKHKGVHTPHTDWCRDDLKDELSADVLISLNKNSSVYLSNFLTLPIARPPLSVLLCHSAQRPPPTLLFLHAYLAPPLSPPSLSLSSLLLPRGHELLQYCNYTGTAGTYLNIY